MRAYSARGSRALAAMLVMSAVCLGAGALSLAQPAGSAARPELVSNSKALTLEGARAVIEAAKADALKKNKTGVIAVTDAGGHVIMLERLDGTFPAGAEVSIGKARTAAIFRKPTRVFEEAINKGRTALVGVDAMTPLQGGVPIVFGGEVIGGVGVSGAASQQQDEEIAIAGAAAVN